MNLRKNTESAPERKPDRKDILKFTNRALEEIGEGLSAEQKEAVRAIVLEKFAEKRFAIKRQSLKERAQFLEELTSMNWDEEPQNENLKNDPEVKAAVEALSKELQEETVEAMLGVKELKTVSPKQLRRIEKRKPGVLLYAFTTWGGSHEEIDLDQFEPYQAPKDGDQFSIDFRGNKEAYWQIGAHDLMPPQVRQITVISKVTGEARTSLRRIGLKAGEKCGFYDENGYIPIFDGDKVIVGDDKRNKNNEPVRKEGGSSGIDLSYKNMDQKDYLKAHEANDNAFLNRLLGVEDANSRTLEKNPPKEGVRKLKQKKVAMGDINKVLETPSRREWKRYAAKATEHFASKFGFKGMKLSGIFAMIAHESGHRADAQNPTSSAGGLGQFINDTWESKNERNGFIGENRELVKALNGGHLPRSREERRALKFNPEISIYATVWYAMQNAASIFKRSERKGLTVGPEHMYDIYLAHHEGQAGRKTMLRYMALRRKGMHPKMAKIRARLQGHQRKQDDSYFQFVHNYAKKVQNTAYAYARQLGE